MENGELVKCLDAHFSRIIDVQPLTHGSWYVRLQFKKILLHKLKYLCKLQRIVFRNYVITSSIDRCIKIWNINYIFEKSHHIDRHELPIDTVAVSTDAGIAVVVTRNCIGIWDLLTGW